MSDSNPEIPHKSESIHPMDEVDHLIDDVLDSNISAEKKNQLVKLLRSVGGSARQTRLLNHITACIIEELSGGFGATISKETMENYSKRLQQGGQFPIIEYKDDANGATVTIQWVDKALVKEAASKETEKAVDERIKQSGTEVGDTGNTEG